MTAWVENRLATVHQSTASDPDAVTGAPRCAADLRTRMLAAADRLDAKGGGPVYAVTGSNARNAYHEAAHIIRHEIQQADAALATGAPVTARRPVVVDDPPADVGQAARDILGAASDPTLLSLLARELADRRAGRAHWPVSIPRDGAA